MFFFSLFSSLHFFSTLSLSTCRVLKLLLTSVRLFSDFTCFYSFYSILFSLLFFSRFFFSLFFLSTGWVLKLPPTSFRLFSYFTFFSYLFLCSIFSFSNFPLVLVNTQPARSPLPSFPLFLFLYFTSLSLFSLNFHILFFLVFSFSPFFSSSLPSLTNMTSPSYTPLSPSYPLLTSSFSYGRHLTHSSLTSSYSA